MKFEKAPKYILDEEKDMCLILHKGHYDRYDVMRITIGAFNGGPLFSGEFAFDDYNAREAFAQRVRHSFIREREFTVEEINKGLLALGSYLRERLSKTGGDELSITCLADVEAEYINWLWFPYIPIGKLTLVEGDPGVGKSYALLAISTAVAAGIGLPGESRTEPRSVLLLSTEDGLSDTIKPRLDALGADASRIFALNNAITFNDTGLLTLEAAIAEVSPALVIIDPMVAYLGAGVDMNKANETRAVLAVLARIAMERQCAFVLLRHLNKAAGTKTIYRGQGSIDFIAACRSALLVGSDPDDKKKRAIIQQKNNLAEFGKPVGYEITNDCFYWTGESDLTADRILANSTQESEVSALDEAVEFLKEALSEGNRDVKEIIREARTLDISEKTLRRAQKKLGAVAIPNKSIDRKIVSGWRWALPGNEKGFLTEAAPDPNPDGHHEKFGHLGRSEGIADPQGVIFEELIDD